MLESGHLLIILHALPKSGQDEREARVFWRSPDGTWKTNQGKGVKALSEHIAGYQAAIDALELQENQADSAEDYFEILEVATPILRAARNLHKAMQSARELLPDDPDLVSMRDDAYQVERAAELLQADIRNSFDLYVAKKTEQMTQSGRAMAVAGHRLNTLAAIFFPTATLAAVFGMNFTHGFEQTSPPIPFLVAIGVGIAMGIGVKSWLDRPG